jgi:SAM-dependent methyltransferase
MRGDAKTWHYGLVARFWAERITDGPEIAYFTRAARENGGPVLDAGCGTGRLLLPLLRAELDTDGCDISADMLRYARDAAAREGCAPALVECALHQLSMPRRYRTVVACGVLSIGVPRDKDELSLRRIHEALEPGGLLLLDHHLPYGDADAWKLWPRDGRTHLPLPWPAGLGTKPPADGTDYEIHSRITAFDPVAQQVTRQMRTFLWKEGTIVDEQVYDLVENYFFTDEMRHLLERAGFVVEAVEGAYERRASRPDDDVIVWHARKPA